MDTLTVRRGSPAAPQPATFGVACGGCPLRQRCTTAADGRTLKVHQHDALQRAHRRRAPKTPKWQADYRRHRPMAERGIAWLVAHGNRRLRYRGVASNNAWLHHCTAALNLRRPVNLGLDHQHGPWTMAGRHPHCDTEHTQVRSPKPSNAWPHPTGLDRQLAESGVNPLGGSFGRIWIRQTSRRVSRETGAAFS